MTLPAQKYLYLDGHDYKNTLQRPDSLYNHMNSSPVGIISGLQNCVNLKTMTIWTPEPNSCNPCKTYGIFPSPETSFESLVPASDPKNCQCFYGLPDAQLRVSYIVQGVLLWVLNDEVPRFLFCGAFGRVVRGCTWVYGSSGPV